MKKPSKSVLVFLALAGLLMIGVAKGGKQTWHYRMTVVVETPEGVKSGSAVREVVYGGPTSGGGGPGMDLKCRGEAVVVDLGKRGVLFALLGVDYCTDIILRAFNEKGDVTLRPDNVPKKGKVTLSLDQYPMFVWFSDLKDPRTVKRLLSIAYCREKDAAGNCVERQTGIITSAAVRNSAFIDEDHFEEAFGKGVRLREVTIEMTDEPITRGIVKKYAPSYEPINRFMDWFRTLHFDDPRRFGPDELSK